MREPAQIEIAAEGAALRGRFHAPRGPVRAHMVLHGATGVPQRFYRHFAAWAADQGIGVLTYDYRDFGKSLTGRTRASTATFADWALRDQAAAEAKLAELAPTGPLWILGHSLGGLGFAFRTLDPRVTRIITVGAGMAHHSDHPWSYRPKALAFWFGFGPLATAICGYLPGKRLMLGADLPAGVYWQWRRWCTRKAFFFTDIGTLLPDPDFRQTGPRLRILTMEDDVVVPPKAVRRYADLFGADVRFEVLHPADLDLPSLGHIEIFAARNAPAWPAVLDLPPRPAQSAAA